MDIKWQLPYKSGYRVAAYTLGLRQGQGIYKGTQITVDSLAVATGPMLIGQIKLDLILHTPSIYS